MNETIKRSRTLLKICKVAVISVLTLVMVGCAPSLSYVGDTNEDAEKYILSTKVEDGWVTIKTELGVFQYSDAYADLFSVKAQESKAKDLPDFMFSVKIGFAYYELFTICYGGEEGIPCGTFAPDNGKDLVVVYVQFADVPSKLSGDDLALYVEAQEAFNEIVASMEADSRFSGLAS